MIKHIIREVAPEDSRLDFYFDGYTFTERAGDYCYTLFVVSDEGWGRISGFNIDEYKEIQRRIDNIIDGFQNVEDKLTDYDGRRYTYKDIMQEYGIEYNSRKCHALKEWSKNADLRVETVADYLTITTGKKWKTVDVCGYSQGDYVQVVYCEGFNDKTDAKVCGEIWLGCAKEFCVLDVEDYAEDEDGEATYTETDSCYGYIVADSQAWRDEDYKKLVCEWAGINEEETRLEMIDGSRTYTKYSYRVA